MKEKPILKRLTNKRMELLNKLNKSGSSKVANESRKLFNLKEGKETTKNYKYKRLISLEIISLTKIVRRTYESLSTDSNFSIVTLRIRGMGNNSI